jgi:hypothetical protein
MCRKDWRLTEGAQYPLPGFGRTVLDEHPMEFARMPTTPHTAMTPIVPLAKIDTLVFRLKTAWTRIRMEHFDNASAM